MTVLETIEAYYDAAPRPLSTVEEIGPFTLFVRADPEGWPYYARPRLGGAARITVVDVHSVTDRQRELEQPQSLEWVHETTPDLREAAADAGLSVESCPLLVLHDVAAAQGVQVPDGVRVSMLAADSPELADTVGAVGAAFSGRDDWPTAQPGPWPRLLATGITRLATAVDPTGVVGGGSHSPRGTTTELTGIAVIPRARRRGIGAALTAQLVRDARGLGIDTVFLSAQDDAVARVYERVGFTRIGTACIARRD